MKKLLRPQDVLLLGLAGVIDIYSELKDPFGSIAGAYKNAYGWVPKRFRKTNCYQTIYHSLRTGYIEKVIKNSQPYLRLTAKGEERIRRDFSIARWQNQKWDGKWRVVIFDIEEKARRDRDVLRMKLRELGFGMIQESIWISPYDIALDFREFIKNVGLGANVFVMEINHLLAGDQRVLASKIWRLDKLNQSYQELFYLLTNLHDRLKTFIGKRKKGSGEREKEREKLGEKLREKLKKKLMGELRSAREKYLEILREDPSLPKELLPEDWYGEKAKKLLDLIQFLDAM